jgi:hypothetical protein
VQSRRELRVIWFLALWSDRSPVERNRVRLIEPLSVSLMIRAPRDLTLHPIRLQTITTRQNCGENLWRQYHGRASGRFVPGATSRCGRCAPRSDTGQQSTEQRNSREHALCYNQLVAGARFQVLRSTSSFLICAMA